MPSPGLDLSLHSTVQRYQKWAHSLSQSLGPNRSTGLHLILTLRVRAPAKKIFLSGHLMHSKKKKHHLDLTRRKKMKLEVTKEVAIDVAALLIREQAMYTNDERIVPERIKNIRSFIDQIAEEVGKDGNQ